MGVGLHKGSFPATPQCRSRGHEWVLIERTAHDFAGHDVEPAQLRPQHNVLNLENCKQQHMRRACNKCHWLGHCARPSALILKDVPSCNGDTSIRRPMPQCCRPIGHSQNRRQLSGSILIRLLWWHNLRLLQACRIYSKLYGQTCKDEGGCQCAGPPAVPDGPAGQLYRCLMIPSQNT